MSKFSRVYDLMQKRDATQLIVCDAYAIFYLTGKFIDSGERPSILYVNAKNKNQKLIINKLFDVPDIDEISNMDIEKIVYSRGDDVTEILANIIRDEKTLMDENFPAGYLLPLISRTHRKYFISDVIERVRLIKTDDEIDLMRDISQITDKIVLKLTENIREDMT